jgi:serine/threonine protein phosphatase PrpC
MEPPELECSALSHIGPVREDNQDAVFLPEVALAQEKGYLFALADGMGGYANGALASKLALETLSNDFYNRNGTPGQVSLRKGVENANLQIFKAAQQLGSGRMGTTLTAAFICGSSLFLAHVGDSRAYLVRGQKAAVLTNDHTTVGDLVRMRVISPEKVRDHPNRSILTRSVGLTMFINPELSRFSLREGDRLLLCSDGMWSVIEDREFADLSVAAPTAQALCQSLIDLALERETDDNISVVAVFARRLQSKGAPAGGEEARRWTAPFRKLFPAFAHKNGSEKAC